MKAPTLLEKLKSINYDKRYISDFEEIRKIGVGGFSSVFEVKNKLDDNFYAVKKIQLKIKNNKKDINEELEHVLREAKFLAKVFHPNIIRYYNCWIELKMASFETLKQETQQKFIENNMEKNNSSSDNNMQNLHQESRNENNGNSEFFLDIDITSNSSNSLFGFEDSPPPKPNLSVMKKENEKMQHPLPQKNPIFNHMEKKAGNLGKDLLTPPLKNQNEDTENIKSILIYIQSELCEETLENYINQRNSKYFKQKIHERSILKEEYFKEVSFILDQIISALTYIHKNCQLVHRDLKPSNIFLNKGLKVKIGDFGLVKKLENLTPLEPPFFFITPSISQEGSPLQKPKDVPLMKFAEEINYFRKAQTPNIEMCNSYKVENNKMFNTRSCGTKTYASPEQWAKNCFFDYRADIYSLGIIMLQMFHPMQTVMELNKTINNSKKANLPKDMIRDLPEISSLIEKMLNDDPDKRPTLKNIADTLKNISSRVLPHPPDQINLGKFFFKKEKAENWETKYLKIIRRHLYFFANESEPKAENVYNLGECDIKLMQMDDIDVISIEHTIQFNCFLHSIQNNETLKLLDEIKESLLVHIQ